MSNNDEKMFAAEQRKALSRRRSYRDGTHLGAALASAGIYELIDTIGSITPSGLLSRHRTLAGTIHRPIVSISS